MSPFGIFRKKGAKKAKRGDKSSDKLRSGLKKTRQKVGGGLRGVLFSHRKLDQELIEKIEEQLYIADVGPRSVTRFCGELQEAYRTGAIKEPIRVIEFLKEFIRKELDQWDTGLRLPREGVGVIMVAGVNGSGKTTTIAKLAKWLLDRDKSVLLAASDTFRAAAVQQLEIWARRVGADVVKNESADPAAVAFDAADKALARSYDVLIIDTAGRLHTRKNLMMELHKIRRVVASKIPGAPHETLMVLDATTGQNAISQAIQFNDSIELSGIVLAKLDGTAKGGAILAVKEQVDVPVKFIGVGEGADDLIPFEPEEFVRAMFD